MTENEYNQNDINEHIGYGDEVFFEKCDYCEEEGIHYFKKFDEWLCESCYNSAIIESLRELSTKSKSQ